MNRRQFFKYVKYKGDLNGELYLCDEIEDE